MLISCWLRVLDDYLICGLVPYQIVDKDFSGRFVGYLIKLNDGLLTIGTTVNIVWKRWRDRKHQWEENSIFGISPFNGNIWWFFRALNYWFLGHQSVTRYQYTQILMTFVIRQLKYNCEAVSWRPGKFQNVIQTTMNVVFTQMTCCANFLECEMWHKQFPSLTAASLCHTVTVRCQWCDPGDNGLASCLMGRHPVPGLTTQPE